MSAYTWKRIPSVTTGGKPHFFRAYDAEGHWVATIVWSRSVRAYAVETSREFVEYVSTVPAGKRVVRLALAQKAGAT